MSDSDLRSDRAWGLAALAAVFVGCALRLLGLGIHSIWYDEGATLYLATAADPIAALAGSRHPPLAIFALRAWIGAFGESDAAVRLLPALLSCVSLGLFSVVAKSWLSGGARFFAVALYAASPFHIWYAQEITPYAFLELGTMLATAGFARALASKSWLPESLGIGVGTAIAFGSQYMGVLVGVTVGSLVVAALATRALAPRRALALLGSALAGGLLWLPWVVWMLPKQIHTDWGNDFKLSTRILVELPPRLVLHDLGAIPPSLAFLGYALGALLWLGFLLFAFPGARGRRTADLWIGVGLLAPLAALGALMIALPPNFQTRYLTAASPFAALAIARGLGAARPAWLGIALSALAAGGTLAVSLDQKLGNRREDYRTACEEIDKRWRPGDRILVITGTPDLFAEGTVRHYFRERPEVLASIGHARVAARDLDAFLPPGTRVHVVYRKRDYARAELDAVAAASLLVDTSPARFDIERRLYWRR